MENLSQEELAALQHWSTYGQKGKKPPHQVRPSEWKLEPFVKPIMSKWSVAIEPHQLPTLLLGFLPGAIIRTHGFMSTSKTPNMGASEDKWFVYADGPDAEGHIRLHMHRSWTGKKMIELMIEAGAISPTHLPDGSAVITGLSGSQIQGSSRTKKTLKLRLERCAIGSWMSNYQMKPWVKSPYPNFPLCRKGRPTLEWLIQVGRK